MFRDPRLRSTYPRVWRNASAECGRDVKALWRANPREGGRGVFCWRRSLAAFPGLWGGDTRVRQAKFIGSSSRRCRLCTIARAPCTAPRRGRSSGHKPPPCRGSFSTAACPAAAFVPPRRRKIGPAKSGRRELSSSRPESVTRSGGVISWATSTAAWVGSIRSLEMTAVTCASPPSSGFTSIDCTLHLRHLVGLIKREGHVAMAFFLEQERRRLAGPIFLVARRLRSGHTADARLHATARCRRPAADRD